MLLSGLGASALYLFSVLVALVFRVGKRLEKQRPILFSLILVDFTDVVSMQVSPGPSVPEEIPLRRSHVS